MDSLNIIQLTELTYWDVCIRIGLAVFYALIIGWDRDSKNKPMDFRAYIIIAISTCGIAIFTQELIHMYEDSSEVISIGIGKIIAGVLTGIGFLGAGAIIHIDDNRVVGTATGASIWASAGIGLIVGFGFLALSAFMFAAMALTLIVGGKCLKTFQGRSDHEDY